MRIFIFSGPGGAGKTTLLNRLFLKQSIRSSCLRAITVTTRSRRPYEKNGKDYFFVSEDEFLYLKQQGFFLENQKVSDHHYGTPKLYLGLAQAKKKNLVLCIDVKGAMFVKQNLTPGKIITIFIAAPSQEELKRRMSKRAATGELVRKRSALAKKELQFSKYYDYVITNKDLGNAVQKAEEIISAKQ